MIVSTSSANFLRDLSENLKLKAALTWLTVAGLVIPLAALVVAGLQPSHAAFVLLVTLLPFQYACYRALTRRQSFYRMEHRPETRYGAVTRVANFRPCMRKMTVDAFAFVMAYLLAFFVRLDTLLEYPYDLAFVLTVPFVVILKLAIFHYVGTYRSLWRYSGLTDLKQVALGTGISTAVISTMSFSLPHDLALPRSVPLIDGALTLLVLAGVRIIVRLAHESFAVPPHVVDNADSRDTSRIDKRRALIVGAGDSGEWVVRALLRDKQSPYTPVAIVDDALNKQDLRIHGIPVVGTVAQLPGLLRKYDIDHILIAVRTLRGRKFREILRSRESTPVTFGVLPGSIAIRDRASPGIRMPDVEDLVARQSIDLDLTSISDQLRGKRVLVIGAGGSIGTELCGQLCRFSPSELQLFGRGESSINRIYGALIRTRTPLRVALGDVANREAVDRIFADLRPDVVFHAAADKHVPLMEMNPDHAVLNNILGTKNVLEASRRYGVNKVVLISSGKAANPRSVVGCCNRIEEMLLRSSLYADTNPIAVRMVNVLGSRGSVDRLFEQQIREGGPITITDRRVVRHFATMSESVSLVIQAAAIEAGNRVFVLDVGESIKIVDLAISMTRMAGLEPGVDIEVQELGLRPGETIREEIVGSSESGRPTTHRHIVQLDSVAVDTALLLAGVDKLERAALQRNFAAIREHLAALVPEYADLSGQYVHAPTGAGTSLSMDQLLWQLELSTEDSSATG